MIFNNVAPPPAPEQLTFKLEDLFSEEEKDEKVREKTN